MKGLDFEHLEMIDQWMKQWYPTGHNTTFVDDHGKTVTLKAQEHQLHAVTFLKYCKREFGFAIIADKMGMGKVLSFISERGH
jgi:hypothetical protein